MVYYFCLILVKIGIGRHILVTFSNIRFNQNSLRYSPVASSAQTERTEEGTEGTKEIQRE